MAIRAVIFDRDGVLTHFDLPYLRSFFAGIAAIELSEIAGRWGAFCAARQPPRTAAEEREFWREFWDHLADALGLDSAQRTALYDFDYTHAIAPFADAEPALRGVRNRGLKVGVLSNFPLATLQESLDRAGLGTLVDVACSAATLGASKPALVVYRAVVAELQCEPHECLFLDDELECVTGAQRAGLPAYWVNRRAASHALSESIVRDLSAIEEVLAQEEAARRP